MKNEGENKKLEVIANKVWEKNQAKNCAVGQMEEIPNTQNHHSHKWIASQKLIQFYGTFFPLALSLRVSLSRSSFVR